MPNIGEIFAQRYQLSTLIGRRGTGEVYRAEDTALGRPVAIKILSRELAHEGDFLKRFRTETQAVARFSHANIVSYYDWGTQDGHPYVVTELCLGGSLRDIVDSGAKLTPAQATQVGLSVAKGLKHAHDEGLIHGGIAPSNILFDASGRAKITDFALAVLHAGTALPSFHDRIFGPTFYAAPEEIENSQLTEKADVYALAVVLVEAVMGAYPFVGETTLSVLWERLITPLPTPPELMGLAAPIASASEMDPALRLTTEEFLEQLRQLTQTMPEPEPLPLVPLAEPTGAGAGVGAGTGAGFGAGAGFSAGAGIGAAPTPTPSAVTGAGFASGTTGTLGTTGTTTPVGIPPTGIAPVGATATSTGITSEVTAPQHGHKSKSQNIFQKTRCFFSRIIKPNDKQWWVSLAAIVVIIAIATAGFFAFIYDNPNRRTLPDFTGETWEDTLEAIGNKWSVQRYELRRAGTSVGEILSQYPEPGQRLGRGEQLTLTVSLGEEFVRLPGEILGLPLDAVVTHLGELGLSVGDINETFHPESSAGTVLGFDEMLLDVPPGSDVSLLVSKGPAQITVPQDLVGQNIGLVAEGLQEMGFVITLERIGDEQTEAGSILLTTPDAGTTLPAGSELIVLVSDGPKLVPELKDLTLAQARSELEGAGICLDDRTVDGTALSQYSDSDIISNSVPPGGAPLASLDPEAESVDDLCVRLLFE